MILDFQEIPKQKISKMRNGAGEVFIQRFDMDSKMIALITLPSQSSIGYHNHLDDYEIIYVISGQGLCFEQDSQTIITAGMVQYCQQSKGHSIVNNSQEPLKLLAIISR